MEVERLQLGGVYHVPDGDFRRRLGQNVPASCSASAGDHASSPKPQKDLLDVVGRKTLLPGNFAPVDRPSSLRLARLSAHMTPYSAQVVIRILQDRVSDWLKQGP